MYIYIHTLLVQSNVVCWKNNPEFFKDCLIQTPIDRRFPVATFDLPHGTQVLRVIILGPFEKPSPGSLRLRNS